MWVVLSEIADRAALWAWRGLQTRGLKPVELVTTELLASSLRWVHRLGVDSTEVSIDLADGRHLDGTSILGVLNRIPGAPAGRLEFFRQEDQGYGSQELSAFYLSWLSALPGLVLNRPTPRGLSGAQRPLSEWIHLAAQAGLPTPKYRQGVPQRIGDGPLLTTSEQPSTVFVVKDRLIGEGFPQELGPACLELAALSETELLGVILIRSGRGEWLFAGADPLPDLRLGGEPLLGAIAYALGGPGL